MNKSVIITGSSRGIGAETARVFAENGFNVLINYHKSEKKALDLRAELNKNFPNIVAEVFKCDVKSSEECKKMVQYALSIFGKIDVLVANAGASQIKPIIDTNEGDFNEIMDTNIKGTYNIIRATIPNMVANKKGKIVTVSSIWGICGASCESIYSSSKAAVIGLTKALSKELGPSKINVNCVAPGFVATEMNAKIKRETLMEIIDSTSLNRVATARNIADAIYFLSSDKADIITGSVLVLDGGFID